MQRRKVVWGAQCHDAPTAWTLEPTRVAEIRASPPCARAQENTLVQFRGDAMHGFDPFQAESGLPRISLVVRSYKVATADYPFTPDFHVPADGT